MFDDHWKVTFNSSEGIAALQLFVDLMKYQPKDVANFDAPDQGACYLQGQCITNIERTQAALDTAAAEVTEYLKGQGYYK